jgi:hypothetical protein
VARAVDLARIPVVDGHCHALLREPLAVSSGTFLDLFTEARPDTMRAHVPHTGYAQRAVRALARRHGVEATVDAVLDARRRAGSKAGLKHLTDARVAALLVDTGYPPDAMPLDEMRRVLGCEIQEVVRIEACAERLLAQRLSYQAFVDAFRRLLHEAAPRCAGFKTIVAYRSGLDVRAWTDDEVAASYARALAAVPAGGRVRLTEKPLLDRLFVITLEIASQTLRPLQIHTGFGDPDIDLLRANPLLLRPVLEDPRWATTRLVLLHMAYPYTREAAFMTAVWPQVYLDLSLALPFLGPGALFPLLEILSLAPSSKLMYGSDVSGLPELFALSAEWARATLGEALGWLVERDGLDERAAAAAGRAILSDNARTLYGLRQEP